jgi:hypothetical protein
MFSITSMITCTNDVRGELFEAVLANEDGACAPRAT